MLLIGIVLLVVGVVVAVTVSREIGLAFVVVGAVIAIIAAVLAADADAAVALAAVPFRFTGRCDPSAWDTLRRLAEEVGWRAEADDHAIEVLRRRKAPTASRAAMTREEFVQRIAEDAGVQVRIYTPGAAG